ncbi:MAG: hypothetical protein A3I61_09370 [Acidobacteria bacterium RIFCSPLOWO2_02_FULL_68_18]|nr:MAG: hypothetical protein A3I61_09370 [Acidobacteria bacterium RIFCSPLOWO2_02_FULL_68_18]
MAERKDSVGGLRIAEALARDYPERISYAYAPIRQSSPWQTLGNSLRLSLDCWRYLDPRYDRSPTLRARAERQAPAVAAHLPRVPVIGSRSALRVWRRLVAWLERAIPPGESAERLLVDERPDLLLLTPLLYFGSHQVDYVRAARRLGIRTVLGVGSWDHLTTKGLIHEVPDYVIVWNEMQRHEAAELHGVDPARVIVTGAQAYDAWFAQQPSVPRAEFCRTVGLPDDRPLLLYLCSSPFIAPYEVGFVRRWIAAMRAAADPELRRAAILIRPHPQNAEQWREFNPAEAVAIWPPSGANPVDRQARADYFDSMYYSVAVVGVNTSALIESGIVGRPVFTVLAEEFSNQQEGTLHFQHLKNVNGGLLSVGRTLDEHLEQVGRAVRGTHDAAKGRAFVESFVRPHGLHVPAAERFVEAIETRAAASPPLPQPASMSLRARRVLLRPWTGLALVAARRRQAQRTGQEVLVPGCRLRVLFTMASPEYLRYYDSTLRLLADQGHTVSVAVNSLRERKHARLELIDDARIAIAGVVPERRDLWTPLARAVRGTMDFVRYLDPRFADTPVLRNRMYRKVLPALLRPLDRIRSLGPPRLARLLRLLQAIERAVPVSRRVRGFLADQQPDVVFVSPLVDAASDQVDTVRAARAAGIPVIAGIASWDNLTNKGHMRVEPDAVAVWNQHQKTEAVELHGIPPERVIMTGAQLFDRWFDREPSVSRADFCRMVGLPDDRPFVLFTGSSVFIARSVHEVPFVRRWVEGLRAAADPVLRNAAVLVRPHPFNPDAWITADLSDLGPVAIWPRARYTPAAEAARASLFDSLYYCQAVVGINTSAMIEAAILGKPVLSILSPEFAGTQDGTIHFRYLRPENGGFLRVAGSIGEHVDQLAAVLRDPEVIRRETERFVASFIRPHGLTTACTPVLAETIAQIGWKGATPSPERVASRALRLLVWPIAVAMWGWMRVEQLRSADAQPAAEAADDDSARTVFDELKRAARASGRRGPHLAQRAARGVRRLPRVILRNVRHVRYFVATVVFQRADKNGSNRA